MIKKQLLQTLVVASLAITIVGCATKKMATPKPVTEQKVLGAVEVTLPFSGPDYKNNDKMYRERNKGESIDMATAKKIAMTNAMTELAGRIQSLVKNVRQNYTDQKRVSNLAEFENQFDEMARIVVRQELQNVDILDEKAFVSPDGKYTYWVVIEMSKDKLFNGLNDKISNNAKLQLEFDKAQFKKIYDEEMNKLDNQ